MYCAQKVNSLSETNHLKGNIRKTLLVRTLTLEVEEVVAENRMDADRKAAMEATDVA